MLGLGGGVPAQWLLDWNRQTLRGFYVLILIWGLVSYPAYLPLPVFITMLSLGLPIPVVGIWATLRRRSPLVAELAHLACLLMVITMSYYLQTLWIDDELARQRIAAMNSLIWKHFAGILGLRLPGRTVVLVFSTALDIMSAIVMSQIYGDTFRIVRVVVFLVLLLVYATIAELHQKQLLQLYQAQQELMAEKEAVESLFSMSTDSRLWLAADGDTIIRYDNTLEDALAIGQSGHETLSSFLADVEGESVRLSDALVRARTMPVLLPTNVVVKSGRSVSVELLIAKRPTPAGKILASMPPSFLVGIRFESVFQPVNPPAEDGAKANGDVLNMDTFQELEEEAAGLQCAAHAPPEDLQSLGSTTLTGQLFARLKLAERCGDVADARRQLRGVVEIGRLEHWIVPFSALRLCPQNILGYGAFGVVVGGKFHGTPVAVKVAKLPRQTCNEVGNISSLLNEVRVLRHVRHPNAVVFYGACINIETLEVGLVFERVRGVGVNVLMHGPPDSPGDMSDRLHLALDVARALRFLHALSPPIVHSDLKSSNVMVEDTHPRPNAKLIDFGLSRLVTTHVQAAGCTLNWAAPEVIRAPNRVVRPSSDVFSFGRLLFFFAVGEAPLADVSRDAIIDAAHLGYSVPPRFPEGPFSLGEDCRRLVDQCVSNDALARPRAVDVHAEVLRSMLQMGVDIDGGADSEGEADENIGGDTSVSLSWEDAMSRVRERFSGRDVATPPVQALQAVGGTTDSSLLAEVRERMRQAQMQNTTKGAPAVGDVPSPQERAEAAGRSGRVAVKLAL